MKCCIALLFVLLTGCYSARDAELVGQVKKVIHQTPLVCFDYQYADISLGVMRGGVGSMSTQDVYVLLENDDQAKTLKAASESGKLVKITYDVRRLAFCTPNHWVKKIEVLEK